MMDTTSGIFICDGLKTIAKPRKGVNSMFKEYLRRNWTAVQSTFSLNHPLDDYYCCAATEDTDTTANTAISRDAVQGQIQGVLFGVYDKQNGKWTVYPLDLTKIKKWFDNSDKERLNINKGNVKHYQ